MHVKSALVTCHAERPLDDPPWSRLLALLDARPGGLPVVPLLRPPDRAAGEDEARWLERARAAAARGPIGLHTHWTSPSHARPSGGDPAERVRAELAWLRGHGLDARLFCGGGWYSDERLRELLRSEGVVDCTATTFRPPVPEPHLVVDGPRDGLLPATHSLGRLARGVLGPLPPFVHAYFHDTDLADARRAAALTWSLRALGLRRRPLRLADVES
jgi:hypothetical protein